MDIAAEVKRQPPLLLSTSSLDGVLPTVGEQAASAGAESEFNQKASLPTYASAAATGRRYTSLMMSSTFATADAAEAVLSLDDDTDFLEG